MLPGGALQQLDELANLGRHARGGAGRVVDANVRDVSPGAALRALDAEAQRPRRSMADTKEARKANMFNEALPPRSIADIASDILDLSQSIGDGFEKAALNIEFDSINPGRKRGPREKGNKIDIGKKPE